jgi:hypothetical protein
MMFGRDYERLPVSPLGLVASTLQADTVPADVVLFCHIPKIAWVGDEGSGGGPDRCVAIVAQWVSEAYADTSATVVLLQRSALLRFPHITGECRSMSASGNDRFARLEPVSSGTVRLYQLTERCHADSSLVSHDNNAARAFLRLTSDTAYWFLFTDARSSLSSEEWRLLLSFRSVLRNQH